MTHSGAPAAAAGPASFELRLKAQALGLGFDLAGIATLGPAETAPAFEQWLAEGHQGQMDYLRRGAELRRDTTLPEPGMRSAIVVALDYGGRQPSGPVARYARGDDYHRVMWDRLDELLAWVRTERGGHVRGRAYVDTGPILERDLARRAGLGWFGKNTMLINPRIGSFFFIGALFLELPLVPDAPFGEEHCGACARCLEACPTQAFVAPGVMDARRCVSYLTIESRTEIPAEYHAAVAEHLYGCDVCQDVCPWNVRFAKAPPTDGPLAPHSAFGVTDATALARELLAMDEAEYRERFRRSAMKRAKLAGLKRNAAIMLGAFALMLGATGCRPQAAAAVPITEALVVPHDPRDPAQLSVAAGRLSVRFRAVQGQVRSARLIADATASPMHRQLTDRGSDLWRGTLPEGTGSYTIELRTAAGLRTLGPFAAPATLFRAIPWVADAVGYQIFPERFDNGDRSNDSLALSTDEYRYMDPALRGAPPALTAWNGPVGESHCCHQYYGGDLQGIRDHLDHLQSLGVTLLYLNPIWSSGSAHGYDTWDYLAVEPSFGDETVLRALLQEARARGIRVMWDFVPNHVGVGDVAFRDALARGPASEHWDWFTFKRPTAELRAGDASGYETFVGIGAMPKLAVGVPAVREHLLDVVRKWTAFGFAGIRVDVPWEVSDAATFFPAMRRAAKAIDPDVYLVGEMWQRAPEWLQGDRFDALMNYGVGQDALERFATGAVTADSASHVLARVYAEYPEASTAMQFNVISTHDNSRLLTKMGGGPLGATPGADALARQRLASAMLFALPGVPVTFQGDECAFLGTGGGGTREDNRYPMQWASCDTAMLAHYRRLGAIKRREPALASPVIRLERGEGTQLAWFRGEPGPDELLVVFNAAGAGGSLPLPAGHWRDIVTDERFDRTVPLAAYGWRYLRQPSSSPTRP